MALAHRLADDAGCVPGVAIGWLLFSRLSIAWLSILLGGLTLVLFGYRLLDALRHRRVRAAQPNALGATWWGSLAGFTSFLIHAGGPPVAVYLLPLQLSKRVYQATTVLFFAFVNAIKLVPYFALGLFDTSNLAISLWLLPWRLSRCCWVFGRMTKSTKSCFTESFTPWPCWHP